MADVPEIAEIDINPFFLAEGEGFALDAEIILEEDGVHGIAVHEVARIAAVAGPGQILASPATRLRIGPPPPGIQPP